MFDRFTDSAKRAMNLARQEAQRFNHEYLGTEHILLGLLQVGSGCAAHVITNMKLDPNKIRSDVEKVVKTGPSMVTMEQIPFTPRAKKVLELSMEEASNLGDSYISDEHLLLGLVNEREGIAAQVLINLGVKLDDVREEVYLLHIDDPVEPGGARNAGHARVRDMAQDLTALAREGKLDEVVGRDLEIERLIQVLSRYERNNALIVGDPGVGRAAIVRGLAHRIGAGNVPQRLQGVRVMALTHAFAFGQNPQYGRVEDRLQPLLWRWSDGKKVILLIENIDLIIQSSISLAQLRNAVLRRGLRFIAISDNFSANAQFARCRDVDRLIQVVAIRPLDRDTLRTIVQSRSARHHRDASVIFSEDAISRVVERVTGSDDASSAVARALYVLDEAATQARVRFARTLPSDAELGQLLTIVARAATGAKPDKTRTASNVTPAPPASVSVDQSDIDVAFARLASVWRGACVPHQDSGAP